MIRYHPYWLHLLSGHLLKLGNHKRLLNYSPAMGKWHRHHCVRFKTKWTFYTGVLDSWLGFWFMLFRKGIVFLSYFHFALQFLCAMVRLFFISKEWNLSPHWNTMHGRFFFLKPLRNISLGGCVWTIYPCTGTFNLGFLLSNFHKTEPLVEGICPHASFPILPVQNIKFIFNDTIMFSVARFGCNLKTSIVFFFLYPPFHFYIFSNFKNVFSYPLFHLLFSLISELHMSGRHLPYHFLDAIHSLIFYTKQITHCFLFWLIPNSRDFGRMSPFF